MTESDESLRAQALAEYAKELRELESALDEMVGDSISEWLDATSIEIGDPSEPGRPIDPDAKRAIAERVLASSAAAILLDRVRAPGDEWEADLQGRAHELRRRACLDLFVLTALADGAE